MTDAKTLEEKALAAWDKYQAVVFAPRPAREPFLDTLYAFAREVQLATAENAHDRLMPILGKMDCDCAGEGVELCYRCQAMSALGHIRVLMRKVES